MREGPAGADPQKGHSCALRKHGCVPYYARPSPTCITLAGAVGCSVDAKPARDLMTEIRKQNQVALRKRLFKSAEKRRAAEGHQLDDYTRSLHPSLPVVPSRQQTGRRRRNEADREDGPSALWVTEAWRAAPALSPNCMMDRRIANCLGLSCGPDRLVFLLKNSRALQRAHSPEFRCERSDPANTQLRAGISCAAASPRRRETSASAPSSPAVTPAALMKLPSTTTLASTRAAP